jgi:hypothetical protein
MSDTDVDSIIAWLFLALEDDDSGENVLTPIQKTSGTVNQIVPPEVPFDNESLKCQQSEHCPTIGMFSFQVITNNGVLFDRGVFDLYTALGEGRVKEMQIEMLIHARLAMAQPSVVDALCNLTT